MHVSLHTTTAFNGQSQLERGSYRRIVGISFEGEQLWQPGCRSTSQRALQETLTIDDRDFGLRLVKFFGTYLAQSERQGPEYNCHLFAAVMTNTVELDLANNAQILDRADDMARGIINQGAPSDRLPLGRQGVLGERTDPYVRYIAHSVIGLGEDRDEFLEVSHTYGYLGIQQYTNSLPYYEMMRGTNGLYTLEEGATPQPFSRD